MCKKFMLIVQAETTIVGYKCQSLPTVMPIIDDTWVHH